MPGDRMRSDAIEIARMMRETKEKGAVWESPEELLSSLADFLEIEGDPIPTGSWFNIKDIEEVIREHAAEWKKPELADGAIEMIKEYLAKLPPDEFKGEPMQVLDFLDTITLLKREPWKK